MPDMTGRPRGIHHSITDNLLEDSSKMENDLAQSLNETASSWVTHSTTTSHDQNEEADLQRAIELSLQVDPSNSLSTSKNSFDKIEQDDLARALAVSINEMNQSTNRKKSSKVVDYISDPEQCLRKDKDWPVGLLNVGNTCWFNVVVQSLFHIPSFRSLIFQFDTSIHNSCVSSETNRSLRLVYELRSLFALMLVSRRGAIDPSRLVSIFQDSTNRNRHEDASEFIHNLLAQLEEAFRHQTEKKREITRDKATCGVNAMLKMFYGSYTTIGRHDDERQHAFSILPLCVKGQLSLHRSLHQATSKSTLDGHEIWFKTLPPVLTFQLSRFHFNQDIRSTEKIHDRFTFPFVIYMDRYLEENKEITRLKREEAKKIISDLNAFRSKLNGLTNYPAASSRFLPLSDALACCAQFASEIEMKEIACDVTNTLTSSRRRIGSGSPSDGLSPCKRSKDGAFERTNTEISSNQINDEVFSQKFQGECPPSLSARSSIIGESIESVLRRWKINVDREVEELKTNIVAAQLRLDRLFEEPHLHNHPYSLHAVLVHQGEALAGHYWAYIRDYKKERWLKFNDTSVTEASFEQVNSDSVGGRQSSAAFESGASAYCLVYTDSKDPSLMSGGTWGEVSSDIALSNLVKLDEQRLAAELELCQTKKEPLRAAGVDSAWDLQALRHAIDTVSNTGQEVQPESALEQGVLCPAFQSCLLSIIKVSDTYNLEGVEAAIEHAVRYEYNRLMALSREPHTSSSDCRLISAAVYLMKNNAKKSLIERFILEQFTDPRLGHESRSRDIMTCASSMLSQFPLNDADEKDYQMWRNCYVTFRTGTYHFIEGLKKFQKRCYFDAVRHLVVVHEHNKSLTDDVFLNKQVNAKLVASYRRTCIQRIHDEVMNLVVDANREVAHCGLTMLRSKLIPCMSILISSNWGGGTYHDLQLADTIRDQWCSLIEKSCVLPREELSEALTEFLDVNPLSARAIVAPELGEPPVNLNQLYEETMTSLQKNPE